MKKTLVEICNAEWKVLEVTRKTINKKYGAPLNGDELDGFTDFDSNTIYINRDLSHQRKGVVLTHELLHVICDQTGFPDNRQERVIRELEHGVYELIHKFPEAYKLGK